jgi:hypothetical protein
MTRDEYARSVGFKSTASAQRALADIEDRAEAALRALERVDVVADFFGYARRSCLAVALAATRGLLAVVRWDLERVSKEE